MKPKSSLDAVTVNWNNQKNYADIKLEERNLKNLQRSKAKIRANKNVSSPLAYNSTAELLEALWNIGAFNGLKDVHGKDITFNTAVDGIRGNVTNLAIENARKSGYDIDFNKGTVNKKSVIVTRSKRIPEVNTNSMATVVPKVNTPILDFLGKAHDYVFGSNTNKNTYENSKEYNNKIDWYKPHSGYDGYKSRLGDLGLVADSDGTYKLYDKNGKLIDLCAQTVNNLLLMLQKHQNTVGNAWTSLGMFGDSMLVNGYKYLPKVGTYNKVTHTLLNLAAATAVLSLLKNLDLLTGDVVGLYSANSSHNDEAWAEGTRNRSNSHEGIVFRPHPNRKDLTYIIHNINGNISVDPISKFMVSKSGLLLDWAPTYVMRPNKGPEPKVAEKKENLTYRASLDGKNFYDFLTLEGKRKYGLDIHSGKNYRLVNGKPVEI